MKDYLHEVIKALVMIAFGFFLGTVYQHRTISNKYYESMIEHHMAEKAYWNKRSAEILDNNTLNKKAR